MQTAGEYLILLRADLSVWQGISGGGEGNETPLEAALRETREEVGITPTRMVQLDSTAMIPATEVLADPPWAKEEIPEYSFLADIPSDVTIHLSREHKGFMWCNYETALTMLKFESNAAALVEARMTPPLEFR